MGVPDQARNVPRSAAAEWGGAGRKQCGVGRVVV